MEAGEATPTLAETKSCRASNFFWRSSCLPRISASPSCNLFRLTHRRQEGEPIKKCCEKRPVQSSHRLRLDGMVKREEEEVGGVRRGDRRDKKRRWRREGGCAEKYEEK